MADVKTFDAGSGSAGTATLDTARLNDHGPRATNKGLHPVVLREAVLMYEANQRVGTVQTKERHWVSGTTKKMYKQKHTGNARQGDGKAAHFRGGGVCFGPHPRDYSYALPKKALKKALRVALASKIEGGEVVLLTGLSFEKPSTRKLGKMFEAAGAGNTPIVVTSGVADKNLLLSVRNLERARVLPAAEVNAFDVVSASRLFLTDGAYDALVERCAR